MDALTMNHTKAQGLSGTSEGASKGWESRKGGSHFPMLSANAHDASAIADAATAKSSGGGSNLHMAAMAAHHMARAALPPPLGSPKA